MTDDNFGQSWDGRSFPECSKEVLYCVFLPIGDEVLYVIWVMNLSMSYQQCQGVSFDDSLHAEGCVQEHRFQRVVWGGQCRLDKGFW